MIALDWIKLMDLLNLWESPIWVIGSHFPLLNFQGSEIKIFGSKTSQVLSWIQNFCSTNVNYWLNQTNQMDSLADTRYTSLLNKDIVYRIILNTWKGSQFPSAKTIASWPYQMSWLNSSWPFLISCHSIFDIETCSTWSYLKIRVGQITYFIYRRFRIYSTYSSLLTISKL